MSVLKKPITVSAQEYLEAEQVARVKHEYVRGHVYAMVGASRTHNVIAGNFYAALRTHLRGSACRAFVTDLKVRIQEVFYYPDVLVTCSPSDNDPYFSSQPVLVIEVLSPHTEAADRLSKRLDYQSLPSLQEYVLAAQEKREISIYRRGSAGWEMEVYTGNEAIRLACVELELAIDEIYAET